MATIENMRRAQPAHIERDMRALDNATLQAQELVQKGAMHALRELQLMGVTQENVRLMLESLERCGKIVTAEVRRRGLSVVEL